MANTESANSSSAPGMPPAGPAAKPQTVDILVAPWQRITVIFRSVHAQRTGETGSVWYWRPDSMVRAESVSGVSDTPIVAQQLVNRVLEHSF